MRTGRPSMHLAFQHTTCFDKEQMKFIRKVQDAKHLSIAAAIRECIDIAREHEYDPATVKRLYNGLLSPPPIRTILAHTE